MITRINKSVKWSVLCTALVTFHLSLSTSSCSDWSDHYDDPLSATSGITLWEAMQQQPQLSDFCEVLEQTKVFRQHRKTSVSYAELLRGGQSFTVMAPVNGTFNKDSLLGLLATDQGDSVVEKSFVLNHLSRYTVTITDAANEMRLANTKRIAIGSGKVGDIAVIDANRHTHNGILHTIQSRLPYSLNLYEAMADLPQFSPVGALLRQYEEDEFDETASLSSGVVDGIPVYVDSVIIERNKLLEGMGLINAEDSTYYMVVPSAAGWQQAWQEALPYFRYDSTVEKRDSVQQYWTIRALLDDAIFSRTIQASPDDSLISAYYNRLRPEYHVFYKPFTTGIMSQPNRVIKCSNGTLYETTNWPFTPEETYFRVLRSEAEVVSLITDYGSCTYITRTHSADSVSEKKYLDIVPSSGTANWNMTIKVNNTLAGTYDICAIILPMSVYPDNKADKPLPCKFRAAVNYVNEYGQQQANNLGNTTFKSDPLRVDTVVLAKGFTFPACNYDQENNKVSVKLTCNILPRENTQYSRRMLLDCIYLRPSN